MAETDARTLAGRRILVTRAAEQSEELIALLAAQGADVVLLPLVRFVAVKESADLDAAIAAIARFDWLIFTSANAARYFLRSCQSRHKWPIAATIQIAAVGPATRTLVENAGLHVVKMPHDFSGAALAAELAPEVKGKRILLPRSDRAGAELPDALRAAGAIVTEVVVYTTEPPEQLDAPVLSALVRKEFDVVTLFSPSAMDHLDRAIGAAELHAIARKTAFAAVGPVTAAAIRKAGLPVALQASAATADSLVLALSAYFTNCAVQKERDT